MGNGHVIFHLRKWLEFSANIWSLSMLLFLTGQQEKVSRCKWSLIGILTHSAVKGGLDFREFSWGPDSDRRVKEFYGNSKWQVHWNWSQISNLSAPLATLNYCYEEYSFWISSGKKQDSKCRITQHQQHSIMSITTGKGIETDRQADRQTSDWATR